MSPLTSGYQLHRRYLFQRLIGTGGMGEVWQAHDNRLDRPVAIKLIPAGSETDIRREAQSAARLTHPHIANVYDFGAIDDPNTDMSGFLVMELLTGQTLAERLQSGPMTWQEAAGLGSQIASALAAAHAQGIVHQDIKPANIMLTATGAKVLDFGIAAALRHDFQPGRLAGTPQYTAPERLHDATPAPAADVYGLAATLFEAMTGRAARPIATWDDLGQHDYTTPLVLPDSIPAEFADVLRTALDPDPSRRPSAATVQAALDAVHFGTTTPLAVPPPDGPRPAALTAPTIVAVKAGRHAGVAAVPPPPVAPTTFADPFADAHAARHGRSPMRVAGLAVLVVAAVIAAVAGWAYFSGPGTSNQSDGPTTIQPATHSSAPTPSESPSSTSTDSVPALLDELQQSVDNLASDGNQKRDQTRELSKQVRRLTQTWDRGDVQGFIDQCQHLRDHLDSGDGDSQGGSFSQVDSLLAQLINAAQSS